MVIRRSNIGWCDFSGGDANFVIGCTPLSEGCRNCYARRIMERAGRDFSRVQLYPDKLQRLAGTRFEENGAPFRRGAGSRPIVFTVDMGDLFHRDVPDGFILQAVGVMAQRDDVDWVVLTKRVERLAHFDRQYLQEGFPPNVWPMTTAENQRGADERLPHLLRVRARVHGVSVEPMLEAVDLLRDEVGFLRDDTWRGGITYLEQLDWVIVGAESGPRRRPFGLGWARRMRDDCLAVGTPFFYKQGSNLFPGRDDEMDGREWKEFPR
jgi:protein gp37